MSPLLLLLIAGLQIPADARPCDPCDMAGTFAARDDEPDQALEVLRRAVEGRAEPEARLLGELGVMGAYLAPDGGRDGAPTREAVDALERALQSEPDNPRWLFAYGFLNRKRGLLPDGLVPELVPLFERFAETREELARPLTPRERAELYAARAHGLKLLGGDRRYGVTWIRSSLKPTSCWLGRAYECPFRMGSVAVPSRLQRLSHVPDSDRLGRLDALRSAFDLEPGWRRVAVEYMGTLARQGLWTELQRVASHHGETSGEAGWAMAFRGAARWRQGFPAEADSLFDLALDRLPVDDQDLLFETSRSVTRENEERYLSGDRENRRAWSTFLLRISDPLFVTPVNERRLEHFTRVILAELWFGEEGQSRGIDTDRGEILVRYGEPQWIWEVGSPEHLSSSTAQAVDGPIEAVPGRRRIYWSYGPGRHEFLFERDFSSRTAQHTPLSLSEARRLRQTEPSTYDFPVQTLPHQVVRFKGRDTHAEVDYYIELPADTLSERSPSVETGLFFLPRTLDGDVIDMRRSMWLIPEPIQVTFRAPLNRGQYLYSLEALSDDGGLRKSARARVDVEVFPEDRVSVSDLLVAREIEPGQAVVRNRTDLGMVPAADFRFLAGDPVAVYFEVYGLAGTPDHQARYRIDIEAESTEGGSIFGRILGGIRGVLGGGEEEGTALSWERTTDADVGRVPEWFEIDMRWPEAGAYTLTVRVRDLVAGEEAVASRGIIIEE